MTTIESTYALIYPALDVAGVALHVFTGPLVVHDQGRRCLHRPSSCCPMSKILSEPVKGRIIFGCKQMKRAVAQASCWRGWLETLLWPQTAHTITPNIPWLCTSGLPRDPITASPTEAAALATILFIPSGTLVVTETIPAPR
jgi:hypothetical protein